MTFTKNSIESIQIDFSINNSEKKILDIFSEYVEAKKCRIFVFSITEDSLEIIWQVPDGYSSDEIRNEFLENLKEVSEKEIFSEFQNLFCRRNVERKIKKIHEIENALFSTKKSYLEDKPEYNFITKYVGKCDCGSCW